MGGGPASSDAVHGTHSQNGRRRGEAVVFRGWVLPGPVARVSGDIDDGRDPRLRPGAIDGLNEPRSSDEPEVGVACGGGLYDLLEDRGNDPLYSTKL